MPAPDLALLIDAAQEAGKIATRFLGQSNRQWDKPGGAGPVTEADLAVNAMLERELRTARPDYGWLSEESTDDPARLEASRVFIIDPIDGTRSFIEGSNTWAHSLAIAERGKVIAGVVFLPMRDKLYAAATDEGASLNGAPISPSVHNDLSGASLLAARPVMAAEHWKSGAPNVRRSHRPSLAYRLALVAEGRYDAMLTLRPTWEWDIAAGTVILQEAGAMATDRKGDQLRFNNPDPRQKGMIAANAGLHPHIAGALF
ncbi:3'(2'),5'-bisphosphate nucleotidase CysQ [Shimia biformata]|uniref:3'(2'),5'-bisphosphate nucleotidase CysQ n=1 Tax=Shimia biformata TaxID=1294299 RepID=UPI001950AD23|nr:3'(2'),5'-bisphosphate nucleotidase CysQ [Shimia biformata]